MEAIPTVLVGIFVFFYLTDRPSEARWLKPEERDWLDGRMVHERRLIEAHHGIGVLRAFFDPKVVMLSLNYVANSSFEVTRFKSDGVTVDTTFGTNGST